MNRNHELHRELWDWLATTGEGWKGNWPKWKEITGEQFEVAKEYWCFACQEDDDITRESDDSCECCPVDFGCGYGFCSTKGSLFESWDTCDDLEQRKIIAAQIRDLPWRGDE